MTTSTLSTPVRKDDGQPTKAREKASPVRKKVR